MRLSRRLLTSLSVIAFLWIVVLLLGPYSFLAPWLQTLYDFYASFGIWPFNPSLLETALLTGALLNPVFLTTFALMTLPCIVIFYHSFYFGYLLLSTIGRPGQYREFTPTVTVLLPALNEEDRIGGTLDALLGSNYPKDKLDILVIASGSTDRTAKIAGDYAKRGPIRVLTQALPRPGKPAALQLGLSQAKNEMVVILDAETRVEPNCLRELVKPLQQPDVVAVQGTVQVANPDDNKVTRAQALAYAVLDGSGLYQQLQMKRNRTFFLTGRNYCVRRALLQQLGGYAGNSLTEDIRLTFLLLEQKGRIVQAWRARASEVVPDSWDVMFAQHMRWIGGWNQENTAYMQRTKRKRAAIINLIDYLVVANGVAFYPVIGGAIGLILVLLGVGLWLLPALSLLPVSLNLLLQAIAGNLWLLSAMFLLPALICLGLQAVAGRRFAGRAGLVTSFYGFFRIYKFMFSMARKPPETTEWKKTEKGAPAKQPRKRSQRKTK